MYDVIVLGGGPGGCEAALKAAQNGLSAALIEKDRLGGTCLHRGCIPMKALLSKARSFETGSSYLQMSKSEMPEMDFHKIRKEMVRIIDNLNKGLHHKLSSKGVDLMFGTGKIYKLEKQKVQIQIDDKIIEGKNLIIATGSKPKRLPPGVAEQGTRLQYSDDFFQLPDIPRQVVVIGAGSVGIEIADFFAMMGKEVLLLETKQRIGTGLDHEIEAHYRSLLVKKGIQIETDITVTKITKQKHVTYQSNKENRIHTVQAVEIFVTIGRTPACELTADQIRSTDCSYKTNYENVFLCGDVNGYHMLAHTAHAEAGTIIKELAGEKKRLDYSLIPGILYTNPELSYVGLTEEECQNTNRNYKKIVLPMTYSSRYFIENYKDGAVCKLIADMERKELIGAHIIGNSSSELILTLEILISKHIPLREIAEFTYPHPTVGEIIREAADALQG